jgi:hypothetical protein
MSDDTYKSDPANYRAMCVPHEGAEAANFALQAFAKDVEEARRKYRIKDVLVVLEVAVRYDDEHEDGAITRFSFGDLAKAAELAAYAYGAESEAFRERLNKLASGWVRRAPKK